MGRRRPCNVNSFARPLSTRSYSSRCASPSSRTGPHLLALFELHHTRRALFRAHLAEPPFLIDAQLNDVTPARFLHCREPISYAEWREFKHAMLYELEQWPAGNTVLIGCGSGREHRLAGQRDVRRRCV